MKKITILILNCIFILSIMIGCSNNSKLGTTNLSNITIDNLSIGSYQGEIDVTKYTTDSNTGNYTYIFDEITINLTNEKVDYISGSFIENKINISINENSGISNINEVTDILGSNFKEQWHDKEQGLMAHEYQDNANNIKAIFIYSNYDDKLVWLKLSQINNK